MLGGADNPNGELPSYITGADTRYCLLSWTGSKEPVTARPEHTVRHITASSVSMQSMNLMLPCVKAAVPSSEQ